MNISVMEQIPLSPLEMALSGLLLVLEQRDPGISDAWVEALESDALNLEVRRLHGPVPDPAVAHSMREAVSLVIKARAIVKAHGAEPRRKKGRG